MKKLLKLAHFFTVALVSGVGLYWNFRTSFTCILPGFRTDNCNTEVLNSGLSIRALRQRTDKSRFTISTVRTILSTNEHNRIQSSSAKNEN